MRVRLHDLSTGEMVEGLRSGRLDVALMVRPVSLEMRSLIFEELCRYPICVAVPKGHRLSRSRTIELREVAGERLVGLSHQDYPEYHEMLLEMFSGLEATPAVVEEHDSATSLIAAVEARHGLAIVASSLTCLAGPRIRVIELRPAPPPLTVGVGYSRGVLSPAAERFVRLLRSIPPPRTIGQAAGRLRNRPPARNACSGRLGSRCRSY